MEKAKEKAPMYMGLMIFVLLAINGYLLKDFYETSSANDKELLKRINQVEKFVSLNTQILRNNKEEHTKTQKIIDFYHPRSRTTNNLPNGDDNQPLQFGFAMLVKEIKPQ